VTTRFWTELLGEAKQTIGFPRAAQMYVVTADHVDLSREQLLLRLPRIVGPLEVGEVYAHPGQDAGLVGHLQELGVARPKPRPQLNRGVILHHASPVSLRIIVALFRPAPEPEQRCVTNHPVSRGNCSTALWQPGATLVAQPDRP
jgi:hypothetical protein